ncbi:hypothetical protein F4814DRAFT_447453 [Daldinia grandis]|nr:hypothetical protein F4814DRAFT_447453 [Daldinia grandis]
MADNLGVKYEPVTDQPPAEQTIDSSPPDGDEISDDPCGSNAAFRDGTLTTTSKAVMCFAGYGTVVSEGDAGLTLQAKIIRSQYNGTDTRECLLAAAVASWEQAASQSCQGVEYEPDADPTGSGCGSGPIFDGRCPSPPGNEDKFLDKRILNGLPHEMVCHYRGRLCTGPEVVTALIGTSDNPYMNHMKIKGYRRNFGPEYGCDAGASAG